MLKLIFVAVALLVAQTASAQTCQLKLDCGGEQPTTDPETVVTRGKQGPRGVRGPKGEVGISGPPGPKGDVGEVGNKGDR